MKGLSWYCRIVFSLFILDCAAFLAVHILKMREEELLLQHLLLAIPLVVYIGLTALCFRGVPSVKSPPAKSWVIFGLVWTSFVVILPILLISTNMQYDSRLIFIILTAGYESYFAGLSLLMMLLFIPAVVLDRKSVV